MPAKTPPPPDLAAKAKAIEATIAQLGRDVKAAVEKAAEETQYQLDKGLAKAMADNPELYADIRRTMRQAKKAMEKTAKALGLDDL
ncbi:MAG: hypothetical protein V4510_09510 [bacterium]